MTTTKSQGRAISQNSAIKMDETFKALLTKGVPLYVTRGLAKQDLDALYVTAYNLYSDKKYKEALPIFEAMTFYNHFDKRGWLGSAACCQVLCRYEDALSCYSSVALLDGNDPLPLFHSVECYFALKKYPEALSALEAVLLLTKKNPEFAHLKNWATKMKETLQKDAK